MFDRQKADGTYQSTTWQIKFPLENETPGGTFKLRIALATANVAVLQVLTGQSLHFLWPKKSEPLKFYIIRISPHKNILNLICRN